MGWSRWILLGGLLLALGLERLLNVSLLGGESGARPLRLVLGVSGTELGAVFLVVGAYFRWRMRR